MRKTSFLLSLLGVISVARAQVVPPNEIKDPEMRSLQERNMDDLKALGADILKLPTDYPFYLSRKLDVEQSKQKWEDQRSIQFDHYKDKVILKITGNYFAAYPAEGMDAQQRARQTFLQVVLPILQIAVPRFQKNSSFQAYGFEISHHVLEKVGKLPVERPENLVVILPQEGAIKLVNSNEDAARQAALLQAEVFLNAKTATIWLNGEGPQVSQAAAPDDPSTVAQKSAAATAEVVRPGDPDTDRIPTPVHVPSLKPPKPARDTSAQALAALQSTMKPILDGMVKELDPQAHFASYASPNFIAFRGGAYLELSINTTLDEPSTASRYRLTALAFDDHIAHLIRPVLGYFKDDSQFDGLGFSATLHLAATGKAAQAASSQAVEFFFPFPALRCYERYDCTGQQLIDAGTVLINGERVGLDLQSAEAGANH